MRWTSERAQRAAIVTALAQAVTAGKVRVAGYSGEREALEWAVESGHFGAVEHSLSFCDQRVIDGTLARAQARGLGVIAKRPVANAPWRHAEQPVGQYVEEYWWRWRTMAGDPRGFDRRDLAWDELALRFAVGTPGVHSAIVDGAFSAQSARTRDRRAAPRRLHHTCR